MADRDRAAMRTGGSVRIAVITIVASLLTRNLPATKKVSVNNPTTDPVSANQDMDW